MAKRELDGADSSGASRTSHVGEVSIWETGEWHPAA